MIAIAIDGEDMEYPIGSVVVIGTWLKRYYIFVPYHMLEFFRITERRDKSIIQGPDV